MNHTAEWIVFLFRSFYYFIIPSISLSMDFTFIYILDGLFQKNEMKLIAKSYGKH